LWVEAAPELSKACTENVFRREGIKIRSLLMLMKVLVRLLLLLRILMKRGWLK
jgi:hypothetical protein